MKEKGADDPANFTKTELPPKIHEEISSLRYRLTIDVLTYAGSKKTINDVSEFLLNLRPTINFKNQDVHRVDLLVNESQNYVANLDPSLKLRLQDEISRLKVILEFYKTRGNYLKSAS